MQSTTGHLDNGESTSPYFEGPFWTLFNALPVGAVLFDPKNDGFLEFNDAACRQLGYTREEFARLRVGDVDAVRTGAEIQAARQQLLPGTAPQQFQTRQRAADGSLRQVDVTLQWLNINGRDLGYAVWHDVTERERALGAVRAREADLARVQRIGRIGGFEVDLQSGFSSHRSPEYLKLYGLPQEAADEPHEAWVRRLHPDDRERMDRTFRETISGGASDYAAEYRIVAPDGQTRWISAIGEIERDPDGRPVRMIGAHIDVTALRQAESNLAAHASRLEEADRRKDEFLAMLGHELRNPLAPILAVSEMLQLRHAEFDPGTRHAHQVIDRQARHLRVLVDELLDVARITTGRITLRKEVVPVRSILAAAQEQAQELIARRAHRFRPDTAGLPQGVCVEGDPARLIQVVSNLLSNAGKYTEPGGDIDMTVAFDDKEVHISVQDSGIGIASEMLPRIFDRFAQFDRNAESSRHGLGIGLTLAQRLVALHGGRITAHSEGPGKGSLFTVSLPRHEGVVPASTDASPASRRPGNFHTGRRVLIVDDNVDAAESLGMLLTMEGHEVHVVHEGSAVLSQARAFRPDVALLDLGLPGRDGFEVARDLREAPDQAGVMLIAVTGYGQEEDRRKTSDAGFAFHLIKPVDVAELLGLLGGGRSA